MDLWQWWRRQATAHPQSPLGWLPALVGTPMPRTVTPPAQQLSRSQSHNGDIAGATVDQAGQPDDYSRFNGQTLDKASPERPVYLRHPARAWRAVKQAKGGPGVDGITLQAFEAVLDKELGALQLELVSGAYQPSLFAGCWCRKPMAACVRWPFGP
ncbi:MAG: hypothetical protein R3E79_02855 [Caldilineaceae bacterium]